MTQKTIRSRDIKYVLGTDVRPGMIFAEGIVYAVNRNDGVTWCYTRTTSIPVHDGEAVQVYAQLGEFETSAFREAVATDQVRS